MPTWERSGVRRSVLEAQQSCHIPILFILLSKSTQRCSLWSSWRRLSVSTTSFLSAPFWCHYLSRHSLWDPWVPTCSELPVALVHFYMHVTSGWGISLSYIPSATNSSRLTSFSWQYPLLKKRWCCHRNSSLAGYSQHTLYTRCHPCPGTNHLPLP